MWVGDCAALRRPAGARHGRLGQPSARVYLRLAPGDDALERSRNAAAALDPAASVFALAGTQVGPQFASLRRAILAGAAATLLLVGASLLVSLLEQVRERRRLLAVLAAFGTRRTTLGRPVLWQCGGAGGARAHPGRGRGRRARRGAAPAGALAGAVDWMAAATLAGVGAAVVLGVTALTLPPLWRVMRADGLRTE